MIITFFWMPDCVPHRGFLFSHPEIFLSGMFAGKWIKELLKKFNRKWHGTSG